jgi:hypothetical protein
MKNCRRKLRGVADGSLWSNDEFNQRMSRLRRIQEQRKGLDDAPGFSFDDDVVTVSDMNHANSVLRDFIDMEPKFCEYLRDSKNWVHEGMNDDGEWSEHEWRQDDEKDCGCGD